MAKSSLLHLGPNKVNLHLDCANTFIKQTYCQARAEMWSPYYGYLALKRLVWDTSLYLWTYSNIAILHFESTLLLPYSMQHIVKEFIYLTNNGISLFPLDQIARIYKHVIIHIFFYDATNACWTVDNMIPKQMCIQFTTAHQHPSMCNIILPRIIIIKCISCVKNFLNNCSDFFLFGIWKISYFRRKHVPFTDSAWMNGFRTQLKLSW